MPSRRHRARAWLARHKRKVAVAAVGIAAVSAFPTYHVATVCGCPPPIYGANDKIAPGVQLLTPAVAATVQGGSVTLSATASDNVGVTSVQFAIDGINVGAADTTAPYSIQWDSTSVPDGSHTVSVTAFDAAGNKGFAGPFPIIVANASSATPTTFRVFVAPGAGGNDADATNCKWFSPAVAAPPGGSGTGCSSFQKAMTLAVANGADSSGAAVAVYGSATSYASGKWDVCVSWVSACDTLDTATNNITFWKDPASSATPVVLTQQQIEGSHFDFEGPFFSDLSLCTGITAPQVAEATTDCPQLVIQANGTHPVEHNVVVNHYDNFSRFYVTSGHDVTIKNSDFGPSYDWHGIVHCKTSCATQADRPGNIIIDNVAVHDQLGSSGCTPNSPCNGSHHVGCGPTLNDAYNVTINRYRAFNCESSDMLIKSGQWQNNDITITNSYFGPSGTGLQIDDACVGASFNCSAANSTWTKKLSNLHIYASTFAGTGVTFLSPLSGTKMNCAGCEVRGNILTIATSWGAFGSDWTLTDNWSTNTTTCGGGATCSNNHTVAGYGLNADSYHILTSSALYHALPASPAWLPATDVDGDARAVSSSPGADDGGNTPPPDTTPPSVSFTAPTNGSTVSGSTLTLSANASDDTGVLGVQFKVDGVNQGAEDTTAPYSVVWDTTGASNASHTLTAVARDGYSHSTTATITVTVSNLSTLTGASTATCSSTCTTGTLPTYPAGSSCGTSGTVTTGSVWLPGNPIDDGSGVATCRLYGVSIPNNLNHAGGSPSQSPAAVIVAAGNGCGSSEFGDIHTNSRWDDEAATGKFIVIMLSKPRPCPVGSPPTPPARSSWLHPNVDVPDPGSTVPSDLPYVRAVVADIKTRYNVDPNRIYFTGASSGGAISWDVACDNTTSALFRGIAVVSNSMQVQKSGSSPVNDTERCGTATNKNFFLYMVQGTLDTGAAYLGTCAPSDHCVSTFDETRRYWAARLGCSATPASTSFGNTAKNTHFQYGGCVFGSPTDQFLATKIQGGGHTYVCQDSETGVTPNLCNSATPSTDGQWDAKDIWDFFSTRQWLG